MEMSNKLYLVLHLQADDSCRLTYDIDEDQEAGVGLRGRAFHAGSVRSAVGVDCGSRSFSAFEILGVKKCESLLLHSSSPLRVFIRQSQSRQVPSASAGL